jgi:hypothetical protein
MTARARLRILAARNLGGDVLPGDFVRVISGSNLGLVESISGDFATCCDLSKPGHREILPVAILMRAQTL